MDGKSYGGYKSLKGKYNFGTYKLNIIKVQGDPFASPTLFGIEINLASYKLGKELYNNKSKKVAMEDYILRKLNKVFFKLGKKAGSGKSGQLDILTPKQEVLKRTAVEILGDTLVVKFYGGLPANGRRINGKGAINMIFSELPKIAKAIELENLDIKALKNHIKVNERSDSIRRALKSNNLISFVENKSNLARKSSIDDRQLDGGVLFDSPKSLEITLSLDTGEKVTGMGIPQGITVITGGGFHGKSTLLSAIEMGVYNHIPKDGREGVITDIDSVKIRAEDGRWIDKANISNFINNLPYKKDTTVFSTENASGSVSQATNIMEALELGAKSLLIDEDTTATNFMIRDEKIQKLISREKEPITPFIDRIDSLKKNGISAIIVVGGLGDYFSKADNVLMLDEYKVIDVTKKAKEISDLENKDINQNNKDKETQEFIIPIRKLNKSKIEKIFSKDYCKIKSRGLDELLINKDTIDIRSLEQLVENGQVGFIGESIKVIFENAKDKNFRELLNDYQSDIEDLSLSKILKNNSGNLVEARKYEIGGAITRIRKQVF